MNIPTTRLLAITLDGFKNVEHGYLEMPHAETKGYFDRGAELLGIYGQNGSGKTAVIDALGCIQILLQGHPLAKECEHFIMKKCKEARISCQFGIEQDDEYFIATYEVCLARDESGAHLVEESLDYAICEKDGDQYKRKKGKQIAHFEERKKPDTALFMPRSAFSELVANKKEIRQKLLIAKALAYDSTKSYLFGKEGFDIFSRELKGEKQTILIALGNFAKLYLTVIERSQSGVIPLNLLPMSLVADVGHGSLPIVLTQPNVMPIPMYEGLKNLLNQINTVLLHIIPGLSINIEKLGTEFLPDGSQGMRFELVSLREENKIPLRYESEGIKKLVSILGVLIDMYNKPYICLVIDELDAGIYEYLLGELFHIIEEGGKGQLIFTSHNLRPLEMIHKNNIVFTTTNPINRFIRFTGIKKDHNLRDMYIRTINLSGQSEEVYAPTESSAIGRAFRRAGKELI